jgi:predicted transcriptional regulator
VGVYRDAHRSNVPRKDSKQFRISNDLVARVAKWADIMRRTENQVVEMIVQDMLDFIDLPHDRRHAIRFVILADSERLAAGKAVEQEEMGYILNDLPSRNSADTKSCVAKGKISPTCPEKRRKS